MKLKTLVKKKKNWKTKWENRCCWKFFEFNKQNHLGQRLKILTADQMLSRLPITLAQLKAGNNSQKLVNEITELLYFFYCSKKLTKKIYNNLINAI